MSSHVETIALVLDKKVGVGSLEQKRSADVTAQDRNHSQEITRCVTGCEVNIESRVIVCA